MSAGKQAFEWERFEFEDFRGRGAAVAAGGILITSLRKDGWAAVAVELATTRVVIHACRKELDQTGADVRATVDGMQECGSWVTLSGGCAR